LDRNTSQFAVNGITKTLRNVMNKVRVWFISCEKHFFGPV